jgi:chromosomal replication initiator protein
MSFEAVRELGRGRPLLVVKAIGNAADMIKSMRVSAAKAALSHVDTLPLAAEVLQATRKLGNPPITSQPTSPHEALLLASTLWAAALPRLRSEFGRDAFKAWIEPLRICECDATSVTLGAPNAYAVSRLTTDYLHRLQARWSSLDASGRRVRLMVAQFSDVAEVEVLTPSIEGVEPDMFANVPSDPFDLTASVRTFANFEVGEANRVAVAIARRVAEEPGNGDVVYFYGLHGAGKTHLLEAIAHELRETAPRRKVLMLTAQKFLNEFQSALRDRDTGPFKAALRSSDVLLIDDLQLICGKSATQDEFFQTLDDLVSRGRTVVCSADVSPEALQGLNARMRCVLQGGFTAKIGDPDFVLRRAIAARKVGELAARRGTFLLPSEALDLIAARVVGTGRAVEGAIKQVFAASALIGREADMEVVVEALSGSWTAPEKSVPVDTIKRRVAAFFDLSLEDLISQRRHRAVARPRQIAMYFCKRLTRRSYPDIGQRFGGRDHTTVMHAVKRIEELATSDAAFAAELVEIGRKITE